MSSRVRSIRIALLAEALLLAPAPGAAQRSVADARERLAALVPDYQRALGERRRRDSLRALAYTEDTIRAPGVTLLAPDGSSVLAHTVADSVAAVLEQRYGALPARRRQRPLRLSTSDGGRTYQVSQLPAPGLPVTSIGAGRDVAAVTDAVLRFSEGALWEGVDSTLASWLQGEQLLQEVAPRGLPRRAFYDLVTSPATVARGCLVGDAGACAAALRLVEPRDALTSWYDPAGHRALLRRLPSRKGRYALEYYDCMEEGDDVGCLTLLRGLTGTGLASAADQPAEFDLRMRLPDPLGAEARRLLLDRIQALGGRGAWGRLVQSPATSLADRVEFAAGAPLDSLLASWRTTVLGAAPPPPVVSGTSMTLALLWTALALGLGMRSTRWR